MTPVILSNFNVEEIASDRMILFNGSVKDAVNKIFLSKENYNRLYKNFIFDTENKTYINKYSQTEKAKEIGNFIDEL